MRDYRFFTTFVCHHCGATRPGKLTTKYCVDRPACQDARRKHRNALATKRKWDQRRRAGVPVRVPCVLPETHENRINRLIPAAVEWADKKVPGCQKGSSEAIKMNWDREYHRKMNELAVEKGLRVVFAS